MPFETYEDTGRYSKLISTVTGDKTMPPSFAVPEIGQVTNDPSLSREQIETLKNWADANGPAGNPADAPVHPRESGHWSIGYPTKIVSLSNLGQLPVSHGPQYIYEIVRTRFTRGRWIQAAEISPSRPANLLHAVVFIRPRDSKWLRKAPVGKPFVTDTVTAARGVSENWKTSDILVVYSSGSPAGQWPTGMAKFIPAGADLIFQMQYVTDGNVEADRIEIGMLFSKKAPAMRILTLQIANQNFVIPPNASEYRVDARGILPKDARLLSCFPLMHLRGKRFEYDIIHRDQIADLRSQPKIETLLRVNYDSRWQVNYTFVERRMLEAGTELQAVAWYDNSQLNPRNPNPNVSVRWGEKPSDEIMACFFDVAIPATANREDYAPLD